MQTICKTHQFFGHTTRTTLESHVYNTRKRAINIEIVEVITNSICAHCPQEKNVTTYDFMMDGCTTRQHATLKDAQEHVIDFMEN